MNASNPTTDATGRPGDSCTCMLQHALDRHERCPGDACPFWVNGSCGLDELRADIDTNPELAGFLLDLRARLTDGDGWRPFRRIHRPGRG